jgi:diguanylate cyclase (GGDEF)-like protein
MARFRPWLSVQAKLLGGFGLVVGLMLALGLLALERLHSDNRHLVRLGTTVIPSTRAVGDINALMNKYRKDQLHYVMAPPADRPLSAPGSIAGDLREDLGTMRSLLAGYRAGGLIEDPTDRRLLDGFEQAFARYVALSAPFQRLSDEGKTLLASRAIGDGASDRAWDRLKVVIASWDNHKVETGRAAELASDASYDRSRLIVLSLLAAALALAVAVAILLAHRTTRAVRQIGAAAKAIAFGDIEQHVEVRSRDELGEMARDFESMVEYLRSTIGVAEAIAEGNLNVEIQPRSERDALGSSLLTMTASLRRLLAENERLLASSRAEAATDALTGLGNRRALMRDLDEALVTATEARPLVLCLFDLDGFKQYNDTFGHPAGDSLLVRLGARLEQATAGLATVYRMGGDEFCVLASTGPDGRAQLADVAARALSEKGEAFTIGCSYGVATLPHDGSTPEDALRVADRRMYEVKSGRASASRQTTDVLLQVLAERSPSLGDHMSTVAELAHATARELGLPEHELQRIQLAAELHDVGKVAIPDSIVDKPGPLDDEEWAFMHRHTEIGGRIVLAAPALAHTAELIRASHERYDGTGYPDGLAGDDIPLGAYVIAVCDAFEAMTSTRPYSEAIETSAALAELRRCAGTQFHPQVVEAFCAVVSAAARVAA